MSLARGAALAALGGMLAVPALAQSGWLQVGRTHVDGASATGTIEPRWEPTFSEAMVCTDGGALKVNDVTFRMRDGKTQHARLRLRLADGGCTKALKVGRKRDLAGVDIAYDPASLGGGKTKLQLVAR
jgi:hypothetical protein